MVLCHLHQYVLTECHLLLVNQITETTICSWLAFLAQTPTTRGSQRSASTIETYARSARAFFGWLVELRSVVEVADRCFNEQVGGVRDGVRDMDKRNGEITDMQVPMRKGNRLDDRLGMEFG